MSASPDVGLTLASLATGWGYVAAAASVALAIGWLRAARGRDRVLEPREGQPLRDPVTELPSGAFVRKLLDIGTAAARRGHSLSVVVFELDDPDGELAALPRRRLDKLLAEVGRVFRRNVRTMNVAGPTTGLRFMAVLANESSRGASVFAERVLRDIAALGEETDAGLTASAGIAAFGRGVADADALLERAGRALRRAQELEGDKVVLYGEDAYRIGPVEPHFAPRGEAAQPRPTKRDTHE